MAAKPKLSSQAKPHSFNLPRLFQALADPTRLRLLNLIADREICVCYLVEVLASPQPKISRHLAYLRNAGIATARRDGKWMHYRLIAPPHPAAAKILDDTLSCLRQQRPMQTDRARLGKACCVPNSSSGCRPEAVVKLAASA